MHCGSLFVLIVLSQVPPPPEPQPPGPYLVRPYATPTPEPRKKFSQAAVESLRLKYPPTAVDYALSDRLAERDHYAGCYGRDPGPFVPNHACVAPWSTQVRLDRAVNEEVARRAPYGVELLRPRYEPGPGSGRNQARRRNDVNQLAEDAEVAVARHMKATFGRGPLAANSPP